LSIAGPSTSGEHPIYTIPLRIANMAAAPRVETPILV
jgi:hypothetical protein